VLRSSRERGGVGDLDEARPAIRVGWPVEKNERYRHLHLPDYLFEAIVALADVAETDLRAG
jgi:hypothetical protein